MRLLPVTDDPLHTMLTVAGEGEIEFQEYFVGRQHGVPISGVRFDGAEAARLTGAGVLAAMDGAEAVVIAPVQPDRLDRPAAGRARACASASQRRGARTVAVSPIVGGAALKGPADRHAGRARPRRSASSAWPRSTATWRPRWSSTRPTRALAPEVEAEGVRCVVTDTIMRTPARRRRARRAPCLDAVGRDGS